MSSLWGTIDPDTMEFRVLAQDLDEEGEPTGDEFESRLKTSALSLPRQ
ncbi:MAG: hypothetical protein Ct9H300mP12_16460 [Acidimicrobiales bacterium]|nr:MAG: hypothetical protein Ct9H300mP12_16460 [Acidimicrobiales bacterium]